jgi:hypothetical protein
MTSNPRYDTSFRKAFDQGAPFRVSIKNKGEWDISPLDIFPFVVMIDRSNNHDIIENPHEYIFLRSDKMIKSLDVGDIVIHYKRKTTYKILGIGNHTETNERLVCYSSTQTGNIHFRPLGMFIEAVVDSEGIFVPRFDLVVDGIDPVQKHDVVIEEISQVE